MRKVKVEVSVGKHESVDVDGVPYIEVSAGHLIIKSGGISGDVVAVFAPEFWRRAEVVAK